MAVDLVTCQRTIAAADALGHIHHKKIDSVDNAGFDLTTFRCQNTRVARMQRDLVVTFCRCLQERNDGRIHLPIFTQARDGDLEYLGSSSRGGRILPVRRRIHGLKPEACSGAKEIETDRLVGFEQEIGGVRIELNTADALYPSIANKDYAIYRIALAKQHMLFFIDGEPGGVVQSLKHTAIQIEMCEIFQLIQRERLAVVAVIAVEGAAKFRQLAQEADCRTSEF